MKKLYGLAIVGLLILAMPVASASRLPTVGGDLNNWGTILNEFLGVSLDGDGNISASVVNTSHILDNTILAADISPNAINNTHILPETIQASDIANASINSSLIQDYTITAGDLIASIINTTHILADTILSADIKDETIAAVDIAPNAINNTHILGGTIQASDLATGSVNTTIIKDYTITAADLENRSINTSHILESTINGGDIAASVINTTHIEDGTLTDADISDSTNITFDDLITFAFGETIDNIYDGIIQITGILNVTGNTNIGGDLDVTGNITGNQIYGEMWNYSANTTAWVFDIALQDTYYNMTNLTVGQNNGFNFTNTDQASGGSYLTATMDGIYSVDMSISYESVLGGGLYGISVTHNYNVENHRNCYARRDATNNVVGNAGIACIIDINSGDVINIQVENEENANDIEIHTVNLKLVRIGDL